MSDIMYSPEHLQNALAELEHIHRKYRQIADRYESLLAGCPGEIRGSSRVNSAYSRGCSDTATVKARFASLTAALGEIARLYAQNDNNINEIVSTIKDFEIPESWISVPLMVTDVEAYIKNEYQYSSEETISVFADEIDVPDWLIREIAKEKFDL